MSFNATLVVLAAGMGSRFGGLKQVEPVGPNGEAILDFSVYDAKKAGFNKVVFIIKKEIEEEFKSIVGKRVEKNIEVDYAFQETYKLPEGFTCPEDRKKPWGTAHAVYCCKDVVKEPFVVINADDFYGASAFRRVYDYLKTGNRDYCMVGFRLKNTLTENGTVSRGVCETENGELLGVTERTKIIDCKYTDDDVNWIPLPEDSVVSMNMWGFTPDIFDRLEADLTEFLRENINKPKAEFYLPLVVQKIIDEKERKIKVLVAEDKWYGVTYKEDKPSVVKAIRELVDKGNYDGI